MSLGASVCRCWAVVVSSPASIVLSRVEVGIPPPLLLLVLLHGTGSPASPNIPNPKELLLAFPAVPTSRNCVSGPASLPGLAIEPTGP
jgi:hypothetical protein